MSNPITVYTITNNILRRRPREPLVQIIGNHCGDINSICLPPKQALDLAKAIRKSALSAKANKNLAAIEIEVN